MRVASCWCTTNTRVPPDRPATLPIGSGVDPATRLARYSSRGSLGSLLTARYNYFMPARAIGTATISFGLVSIPTKLFTTNESAGDIHFNMLHDADGARLRQQYVCTKCNEIVDREHTTKGF